MKLFEINSQKLKIFFEMRELPDARLCHLPDVSKISDREIVFDNLVNREDLSLIEKMTLFIYCLGRWKEYHVSPLLSAESLSDNGKSFNLLSFVVDEKDQASFKQDLMLVQS